MILPLGSEGGFHFRIIWDEELETEMGSRGTEGSAKEKGDRQIHCEGGSKGSQVGMRGNSQVKGDGSEAICLGLQCGSSLGRGLCKLVNTVKNYSLGKGERLSEAQGC